MFQRLTWTDHPLLSGVVEQQVVIEMPRQRNRVASRDLELLWELDTLMQTY